MYKCTHVLGLCLIYAFLKSMTQSYDLLNDLSYHKKFKHMGKYNVEKM